MIYFVGVGEGCGKGIVGTIVGVPLTVGDAPGEPVGVCVPLGDGDGLGVFEPFGVGETSTAVKNAACGMVQDSVPFVKVI